MSSWMMETGSNAALLLQGIQQVTNLSHVCAVLLWSSSLCQGWGKFNPNTETWEPMENSIKKSSQTIWRMDWPEVGGGGDKRTKCGHNEM